MKTVYTCFPGGKFKCLTMSYDDGRVFDRQLVDIFNQNGVKGTFHLNSGIGRGDSANYIQPEEYQSLYAGHEIACHTAKHPTIARCPMPNVITEVLEDRAALETAAGYPVRGLSYPNGSYSSEICDMLKYTGIRYARTVSVTNSFAMPGDFLRWQGTCKHNSPRLMELANQFLGLYKSQYQYLMYVWGHSYEFDNDKNWNVIEDFCQLVGHQDDIWYATNIEIVDYMDVFNRLQFAADNSFVFNPSCQSAWLSVDSAAPIEIPGGQLVKL